ncbi:MAG: hypothetical protein ACI91J_001662, partial [Yoonia sp.]
LASDSYKLVYHYHCKHLGPLKGFTRERKFTKLLDISIDEDKLMAAFGKTTRYEVRRAGNSDELQFGLVSNWETFLKYYNGFAALKEMPEMDPTILRSYWPHCVVTEACFEGQPLVMHTYVVDPVASRINLTYSATHLGRSIGNCAANRAVPTAGFTTRTCCISNAKDTPATTLAGMPLKRLTSRCRR